MALHRIDDRSQLRVDHQQLGPRVVADVAHLLRCQARVDRDQDRPRKWNGEMCDQQLGDVRTQVCHAVARTDTRRLEGAGEASGFEREIPIRDAPVAVDDRHFVRIDLG